MALDRRMRKGDFLLRRDGVLLLFAVFGPLVVQAFSPHASLSTFGGRPFRIRHVKRPQGWLKRRIGPREAIRSSDHDDDQDFEVKPEQSQMMNYVANYLKKTSSQSGLEADADDPDNNNPLLLEDSHLIALPTDACHGVLLELESVQRAVLYHCPVLVHACLTGAQTRIPLLYVQDSSTNGKRLQEIVEAVVARHFCAAKVENQEDDVAPEQLEASFETIRVDPESLNAAGISPLLLQFTGLDLEEDGSSNNNAVLCTKADAQHAGTLRLQRLTADLQQSLQLEGVATRLAHATTPLNQEKNDVPAVLEPRLTFMRLPSDWDDFLRQQYNGTDPLELTSDQGGNGISPILWGQWMDDDFGQARMPQIAIYPKSARASTDDTTEAAYRYPELTVDLPLGNESLMKEEARQQKYQDERMKEAEAALKRNSNKGQSKDDEDDFENENDDMLLSKTRDRLEALYQTDDDDDYNYDYDDYDRYDDFYFYDDDDSEVDAGDVPLEPRVEVDEEQSDIVNAEFVDDSVDPELLSPPVRPGDENELDDWTRERIRKAIASRARVQSEQELAKPKDKPPIEQNPVFAKYKDGSLTPPSKPAAKPGPLPPFPSREHVKGFWRVVGSPTGFEPEDSTATASDNLILRVDGTTAGGPILDQETRQKASGGTWKLTTSESPDESAILRIRLVVPPKKERILVMQGPLERASLSSDLPMASTTFGIPQLEARKAAALESSEMEDLLYCSGMVWMEDAVTGANRQDIGRFSLQKLDTPSDPTEYTITIPRNVRSQD